MSPTRRAAASNQCLRRLLLNLLVCLLALALDLAAQQAPPTLANLPSYEGQPVTAVELAGWPGLDPAPLLQQLPQKAGAPFSRALVDQSIGVLKRRLASRHLQQVQLQVRPEPSGIRVLFILEPAQYFGVYEFPGALQFSYPRLLEAAHYASPEPYTPADVVRATTGLAAFFQQQGYFLARLRPQLRPDPAHGLVNVSFHVALGPRARFGSVRLDGASPAQAAALRGALRSWWARLRRTAILPGKPYDYATLLSAALALQSKLNARHHLGAQVRPAAAQYHPDSNRADLTFLIVPGPLVHLHVTGAHLWPWTRRSLLPIYQESRVDPELILEGQDNLANYFAAHGYFNAQISTTVTSQPALGPATTRVTRQSAAASPPPPQPLPPAPASPPVEQTIVYSIVKGPRRDVESIQFSGNDLLSRDDLVPQVAVRPEHFLSHGAFSQPLLRTSLDRLTALYQASGYSSVRVLPRITHPGGNLALRFEIHEGPQDFVASLRLADNSVPADVLAPQGLQLGPGTPFAQSLLAQDRAQILAYYLSHGYLNASFRATAQQAPGHPHQIQVVYNIDQGPQVRTAAVFTEGRHLTRQRLVDDRIGPLLRPGRFLTENDMLGAESQLYAPGIFDWAEVGPRRPIASQALEDVVVKLHESPRNALVYGFGFDLTNRGGSIPAGTVAVPGLPIIGLPSSFKTSQATFYGPTANVEYTRLNLLGKAETFSAGLFAGRLDQRGSLTYSDPSLFWSPFSANLQLAAEHDSQNPIFTSQSAQIGFQLERPLNPDQTTNLFLRYSLSQVSLTRLLIPDLVPARDQHVRLSTLSATFLRDTRDNPLDAHKGILQSYQLDYSPSALGSTANFAKLLTQTAYYRSLRDNIVWANSFRLGLDKAFGHSFVPLSQAFFSGGGSTLRGFPLDGAGPQKTIPACGDPANPATCSLINVPLGGNELLLLNSEFRIPIPQIKKGLGIALFYDGGNVFSHIGFRHLGAGYTNSIGAGLRYDTPVGPIRLDLGHNLNAIAGIKSTQIFITLGQAF
ncbi:MAG TPA: BamA/TamA family outer membrane protein [Terriglobales bacterium]|nr:BamA/TamA family outer membrane protein [Terriglobales bacterium]